MRGYLVRSGLSGTGVFSTLVACAQAHIIVFTPISDHTAAVGSAGNYDLN